MTTPSPVLTKAPGWKWVTLHLARSPDYPEGSDQHGYNILAPLDGEGHIDQARWKRNKELCIAMRFWAGEPNRYGRLRHRAGGEGGATWVIDYDAATSDDDEAGYKLDRHHFAIGEYLTLGGDHGAHTFRVANMIDAAVEQEA